ncbi:hypothetical protein QJQ45_029647, partial [Haematococcus lacustris]
VRVDDRSRIASHQAVLDPCCLGWVASWGRSHWLNLFLSGQGSVAMAYNPDTMSFDLPSTDMVYVAGLPQNVTESDIAEYFGSIGVLKVDKKTGKKKIWLYRDKDTGALKGDGTVTYEDPFSASSAVEWFNNKDWKAVVVAAVSPDDKQQAASKQLGNHYL